MIAASRIILLLVTSIFSAEAQIDNSVLPPNKIINLVPNKFGDFYQENDSQGKLIALGTLKYSMVQKNFVASRKRSIKVLLFDYGEAAIMYNQATRKFSTFNSVNTDTLIFQSLNMTDCTGWESYNVKRNFSQIMLGVCGRFFLTLEGSNVELNELKKVVEAFKFETFPKINIDAPKSR